MFETVQYYRQAWARFVQSIIIHKVANVNFFDDNHENVYKSIKYVRTKNRTLGDPS